MQYRLPSDQDGMQRCAHPGKGRIDQRLDLACGRSCGTAPLPPERHPDASVQRQPLQDPGGGDGTDHRLETERMSPPGEHPGADPRAEERGHHGPQLWPRSAHDHPGRGAGALPDPQHGRDHRRGLHALGRPGRPERSHYGHGQGGPEPRCHDRAEDPGDGIRDPWRPR